MLRPPSFIEDIATDGLGDRPAYRPPEPRPPDPPEPPPRDRRASDRDRRGHQCGRSHHCPEEEVRAPGGLTPREAAFAVALLNRSRPTVHLEPGPGAGQLARAVWRARPRDCLDAAFAAGLAHPPAGRFVDRLHRVGPADAPPFLDETLYRCLALYLGTVFVADATGYRLREVSAGGAAPARGAVAVAHGDLSWLIAPRPCWLPALAALSCARPDLVARVGITTPAALAAAFPAAIARQDVGRLAPLHAIADDWLAERRVTPGQAAAMAATALLVSGATVALPALTQFSAAAGLNLALLGHAATRLAAASHARSAPRARPAAAGTDLPVYSVLVPLHREAGMARQIVRALAALDYPADRLDIQFLVEADDTATRLALAAEVGRLGGAATITVVPDGRPRTKPRALNVGLKRARGDIVTVFDAEDRPEADQLRKVVDAFAAAPPEVACLQARLVVDHADDSWITRMFAIEYASLFDGILPMLSDGGWFFLLGGTSNHFRRDALVEVGGWDPFNVTEDADLSVRLARAGYRLKQLDSATYEEAPLTMGAWMRQRTRWFKGWMQTWLVHNRNPLRLVRDMGLADAVVFHVLVLGSFLSTLAHPFFCVLLALYATGTLSLSPELTPAAIALFALNAAVFIVGYGATFWLGALAMRRRGMPVPTWAILTLPVYWFLMSAALAMALRELILRPHYWAKTHHGLAHRPFRAFGPGT